MQHVPYETRQEREVIYITDPPRRPVNGLGITGFVLSLVGLGTCGVTSPFGLLFSLMGMFRAPRGLATAGLLISAVPTALWGGMIYIGLNESHWEHHRLVDERRAAQTREVLGEARDLIEQERKSHQGELPEGIEGNKMVVDYRGGWNEEIRYEPQPDGYNLRSAGRDRSFDTPDDVVVRVRPGDLANIEPPETLKPAVY